MNYTIGDVFICLWTLRVILTEWVLRFFLLSRHKSGFMSCIFIHNLTGLSRRDKRTHSLSCLSEYIALIEWPLMTPRVNLCLAGSSGCLRGRLIKGNETSWGLSLSRSLARCLTDSHWSPLARIPPCLRHGGYERPLTGHRRTRRPLCRYTC